MIENLGNSRIRVFVSYTHRDDRAERGRILELAKDLSAEYQLISGNQMELFIDRDSISWGRDWRQAIDAGLEIASILIPVLTPGYFKSPSCRNELADFLGAVERNKEPKLILPLMYVPIKELMLGESDDPLVSQISKLQILEWNGRFFDGNTGNYRRCINELAERLLESNEAISLRYRQGTNDESGQVVEPIDKEKDYSKEAENPESIPVVVSEEEKDIVQENVLGTIRQSEGKADDKGFVERINEVTIKMESSTELLTEVSKGIETAGEITMRYTGKIEKMKGKNVKPAALVTLFREMANEMKEPSEEIEDKGREVYVSMLSINEDVLGVIDALHQGLFTDTDAQTAFYRGIRNLNASAQEAKGSFTEMNASIDGIMGISRDLNIPLKKIKSGVYSVLDTCNLIYTWNQAIDEIER